VLVVLEFIIFCLPISILAYVPKFFFGSTPDFAGLAPQWTGGPSLQKLALRPPGILTFIAIDLMASWLIFSYKLVHFWEYVIIWLTFIAIIFTNLEIGMGVGIGLSILGFILQYAQVPSMRLVFRGSNLQRGFHQRSVLAQHRHDILCVRLEGYIFFGSSLRKIFRSWSGRDCGWGGGASLAHCSRCTVAF
jgi:SulP family sulfate permease